MKEDDKVFLRLFALSGQGERDIVFSFFQVVSFFQVAIEERGDTAPAPSGKGV